MEKRSTGQENTITEYVCPSGEFFADTQRPITREVIACHIKMTLEFNTIDKDALKWEKELQKQRNTDTIKWTEEIQQKIYDDENGLLARYTKVCRIPEWKDCAKTTEFYPEAVCEERAQMKAKAWKDMAYILAAKGVAKGYQNDKDTFLDETKTVYDTVLQKWLTYKGLVDTAVSKFTAYIKKAVK